MAKCIWVTGLSGTGKTTLSTLLVEDMRLKGVRVIHLDGDELRQVLADEAYTREERIALGMRYSRLCKLLVSQGFDVVIAVIGLFKELQNWNRENIPNYFEVFIDTNMEELMNRDPKKIYQKYNSGEIKNVAGLDLEVDFPDNPNIYIKWSKGRSVDSMYNEFLSRYIELCEVNSMD